MKNVLHNLTMLVLGLMLMASPASADSHQKNADRIWFGMRISGLNLWNAKQAGLGNTDGVIITKIDKGDIAEKNGFRLGDVLLAINGKKLSGLKSALGVNSTLEGNARVTVVVLRAGTKFEQTFVAGTTPIAWQLYHRGNAALKGNDFAAAHKNFKLSAKAGLTEAMIKLGDLNRLGQGAEPSGKEAARWYQMAVDNGNFEGLLGIGVLYYNGNGVEKSPKKAADAFTIAASKGSFVGMSNLAIMADQGLGMKKDSKHAATLVFTALKHGTKRTVENMTNSEISWSKEFVKTLQLLLKAEGIYTGKLDGVLSKQLRDLIETYFSTS